MKQLLLCLVFGMATFLVAKPSLSQTLEDSLATQAEKYFDNAEYNRSLGIYLELLKSAEERNDSAALALRNFDVGRSHYFFRSDSSNVESMPFLQKAYQFSRETNNEEIELSAARGLGAIYGEFEQYDSSFFYLNIAIGLALEQKDYYMASGLECIIGEYLREGYADLSGAMEHWLQALDYAKLAGNRSGYAFALEKVGQGHMHFGNYDEAIESFQEAEHIYDSLQSKNGLLNIYSLYGRLYKKNNRYKELSEAQKKYIELGNAVYNENLASSMAEMKTKFETEKKEKENLVLKKDNAEKELDLAQSENQRNLLLGSVFLLLILGGSGFYIFRQQQEKKLREEQIRQEKMRLKVVINTQEKERKRIAGELHDGIGQTLSAAKLNLSALGEKQEINQNEIYTNVLQLIDESVTEVRGISHEMMPASLTRQGLAAALIGLTERINSSGKIKITIDTEDLSERLPEQTEVHIYRILQELLTNILKYANAKEVFINITKEENGLSVMVEDDGKGFNPDSLTKGAGNGWANIASRLELINGQINVDSNPSRQGTVVLLEIDSFAA